MTINDPPEGDPGMTTVIELVKPDDSSKVRYEKDGHAVFPTMGSYLVFNGKKKLESVVREYKKQLKEYNKKLTDNNIPYRLRVTHTVTSFGRKYVYCGRYIYKKLDDNSGDKYVCKFDPRELRNLMGSKGWNLVGPPPRNIFEGLRYEVIIINQKESQHIILPSASYLVSDVRSVFTNLKVMRLA